MCGLSGCFGDVGFKEEKVIKTLLIFNQVRGEDSTGVGSVSKNLINDQHEFRLAKEVGTPNYLFETKRFDKVFQGNNFVYIGHNRAKTVGENVRTNAHPFMFNNVMGAHNGTIDWQNKNRLESGSQYKTDSEAIFANIEAHGIEDTIGRLEATEAYALTWFDRRDNTMNFIRNKHRPLIWCTVNGGKTLFYGSEYGVLMAALGRDGYKPDDKVWEFTEDVHFSWVVPTALNTVLPDPVRKKFKNYTYDYSKKNTAFGPTHGATGSQAGTKTGAYKNRLFTDNNLDIGNLTEDGLWQYQGRYVGWVPVEQTVTKVDTNSNVTIVQKAIEKLAGVLGTTPKTATTLEDRAMTADDILRRKALERAERAGLIVTETDVVKSFFKGPNLKVWRNTETGDWTYLQYNSIRDEWDFYSKVKTPPDMLPYTLVDVASGGDHSFKHVGKKKKKKIFYRGYGGHLCDRDEFENIMACGCVGCSRSPEWGNKVSFFSKDHEFLCQWCSLTPGLVESFVEMYKQDKQKKVV